MSNKPRNKKHNQHKRAKRFFSNVRIWSWESSVTTEGERIAHSETKLGMFWRDLSQKQVNSIVSRNHNWVICCRALCEVNNDVWIETEMRSARDIKVNDLADEFEKMRVAVLECVQKRHVVDVGWIIQTFDKHDRIDENLEMIHRGDVTEERRRAWLASSVTYHERVKNAA